jgi:hypothetical protein
MNITTTRPPLKTASALALTILFALFQPWRTYAQPTSTVAVELNRPFAKSSLYKHWRGAEYRWTVTGRGNIGQLGDSRIMQTTTEIDARFVLTSLGAASMTSIFGLPVNPKLPFDANGIAGEQFCAQASAGSAALRRGSCNIFFATNALLAGSGAGGSRLLDPLFALGGITDSTQAATFQRYAFVPDFDTLSPQSLYTARVLGSDIPAQFLFIDRLGEQSNTFYGDNQTAGRPTTFQVTIERLSPELVVTNKRVRADSVFLEEQVRTDAAGFDRVAQTDTVDFGNVSRNTTVKLTRFVRNRGTKPLAITGLEYPMNLSFIVTPRFQESGLNFPPLTLLRRTIFPLLPTPLPPVPAPFAGDSLPIDFTFSPRDFGEQQTEFVIFMNDSTRAVNGGGKHIFRFVLRGTGVNAALSGPATVDFRKVRVGTSNLNTSQLVNNGTTPLSVTNVLQPASPFAVQAQPPPYTLQASGQAGSASEISFQFAPTQAGLFVDEAVVRGAEFPDYRVQLRGIGAASGVNVVNELTPTTDTVDFGVVVPGSIAERTISIENTGNIDLNIASQLEISPNGNPADVLGREFEFPAAGTPLIAGTRRLPIKFAPPLNARSDRRELFLDISVREAEDNFNFNRTLATRRFVIRARVGAVLAVDSTQNQTQSGSQGGLPPAQVRPDRVLFDSVYVGERSQQTLFMRNLSSQLITLQPNTSQTRAQVVVPQSGSEGVFVLTDSLRSATFTPNQTGTAVLRYAPTRLGRDSAAFEVTYRTTASAARP